MDLRLMELERRLERAERRARCLFVLGLAVLVGGVTLMFARPAETQAGMSRVRAPFQVTDANGRVVFEVAIHEEGPFFRVINEAGKQVLLGYSDADGGNMLLHAANGSLTSSWFTDQDGGNITLRDRNNRIMVELTNTNVGGQLILRDRQGNDAFRRP